LSFCVILHPPVFIFFGVIWRYLALAAIPRRHRRHSVNPQPAARIELLRLLRFVAAMPQRFAAKRRKIRKKNRLKVKSGQIRSN
jgi:hypothetical protein